MLVPIVRLERTVNNQNRPTKSIISNLNGPKAQIDDDKRQHQKSDRFKAKDLDRSEYFADHRRNVCVTTANAA